MSRRLEKINRTILETVSKVIQYQLSDPRIKGMVSVTRVEVAPDITTARVYLSVMGCNPKQQELTVRAISHAAGFIQSKLGEVLTTRTCPTLKFFLDNSLKKGFEIMQIINQVSSEFKETPAENAESDSADETNTQDENEKNSTPSDDLNLESENER